MAHVHDSKLQVSLIPLTYWCSLPPCRCALKAHKEPEGRTNAHTPNEGWKRKRKPGPFCRYCSTLTMGGAAIPHCCKRCQALRCRHMGASKVEVLLPGFNEASNAGQSRASASSKKPLEQGRSSALQPQKGFNEASNAGQSRELALASSKKPSGQLRPHGLPDPF